MLTADLMVEEMLGRSVEDLRAMVITSVGIQRDAETEAEVPCNVKCVGECKYF